MPADSEAANGRTLEVQVLNDSWLPHGGTWPGNEGGFPGDLTTDDVRPDVCYDPLVSRQILDDAVAALNRDRIVRMKLETSPPIQPVLKGFRCGAVTAAGPDYGHRLAVLGQEAF